MVDHRRATYLTRPSQYIGIVLLDRFDIALEVTKINRIETVAIQVKKSASDNHANVLYLGRYGKHTER